MIGAVEPLIALIVSLARSLASRVRLTISGRRSALWQKDPSIIKDWNIQGWRIARCHSAEFPGLDHKCAVRGSIEIMIGEYILCLKHPS